MNPYAFAVIVSFGIMLVSQLIQTWFILRIAPKRTIKHLESYLKDPRNHETYNQIVAGICLSPNTHTALDTLVSHIGESIFTRVRGSVGGRMKGVTADLTREAREAIADSPDGAQALAMEEMLSRLPEKTGEKIQGLMGMVQLFQSLKAGGIGGVGGTGGALP